MPAKYLYHESNEYYEIETIVKNLSNDKSMCILRSNKRKRMDKDNSNNKISEILNDNYSFKIIKADSTILQENKLIRKLK